MNLHSTVYSVKLIGTSSKAKSVTERMVKLSNKKIKMPHKNIPVHNCECRAP